jgi:hypothetical protein
VRRPGLCRGLGRRVARGSRDGVFPRQLRAFHGISKRKGPHRRCRAQSLGDHWPKNDGNFTFRAGGFAFKRGAIAGVQELVLLGKADPSPPAIRSVNVIEHRKAISAARAISDSPRLASMQIDDGGFQRTLKRVHQVWAFDLDLHFRGKRRLCASRSRRLRGGARHALALRRGVGRRGGVTNSSRGSEHGPETGNVRGEGPGRPAHSSALQRD